MKIQRLLIAFVMLMNPLFSWAQDVGKQHVPVITLGRIPLSETKNGRIIFTSTTRQDIIKNALFIADVNNCHVTEYQFTMIAPGRPYFGPYYVNGGELNDSIKTVIKEINGPNVKVYIEHIKIIYRGREMMAANSVAFKYDD